jgi:YfiH family protein
LFISKKLSKFQKINHGFFNRNGGKSTGIYKSLNCGLGSKDKIDIIKKNLKIVKNKISKNSKNIFLVHQFHSNKFIYINKKVNFSQKKIKADAIITDQVNLPIAVLTADCVPILLYDHKRNMIAAIHAGWKGAFKEIIKKVINFMIIKGCTKNSIIAVVGPCIQKNSYNIGEEFKKRFLKKDKKNNIFFKKKNNVLYFDLPNFVKSQLKLNKITNIDMIKIDTFDQKNNFFSARRSLRLNHDDYGRNISIIMIN